MTATKTAAPATAIAASVVDFNDILDRPADEVVELYGERIYPFFAPEDKGGKQKEFKKEAMVKWLEKLQPKLKKAAARGGLNGIIETLKKEGLEVEVKASGNAAKALQLEDEASFNWSALLKWAAIGVTAAVVVIGGVYLYLRYSESKKADGGAGVVI